MPYDFTKTFFKWKRNTSPASISLASKIESVFNCCRSTITSLSKTSTTLKFKDLTDPIPDQLERRLTASRVFYTRKNAPVYLRSKKVSTKYESETSEGLAISEFTKNRGLILKNIEYFHPVYFHLSSVPDAVVKLNEELIVIEVKAIFRRDGKLYNELDNEFERTQNIFDWGNKLQFSLSCCGIDKGVLIIWNYDNSSIYLKIHLHRE